MRITQKNQQKSKRTVAIIVVVSTLVLASGMAAFLLRDTLFSDQTNSNPVEPSTSTQSTNLDPATGNQKSAGDKAKEDFINNSENVDSGTATISISSTTKNGNIFSIRTIITAVDETGSCTVTLTSPGKDAITQSVGTQSLGSYSVCKGFDIDIANMGNAT